MQERRFNEVKGFLQGHRLLLVELCFNPRFADFKIHALPAVLYVNK